MQFNLLDEVVVLRGFHASGNHIFLVVGHMLEGRVNFYRLLLRDESRVDSLLLREWFRESDLQKYDYRKQHIPVVGE